MSHISPNEALNKAYRQIAIETSSYNMFCEALQRLLDKTEDGQREETQKEHLREFLSETFYKQYYMAPEGDVDLSVHLDRTAKSNIGLLIEVKSTTNKNEMISNEDLNRKALQELLLYYLRERVTKRNNDLKYLIATNIYEFFIFDAQEFERKFYQEKKLIKEFVDFQEGRKTSTKTDFFYTEIASKYIESVKDSLEYTYFNLLDYKKNINTGTTSRKIISLYKILSDTHLLKLTFQNDSNSLNKNFYAELLHIIGIEEKKVDNKAVIVRKDPDRRDEASLLENTINQLDAEDCLRNINRDQYGDTKDEQLFNVAMELCITWINRVLFLKLLEAQLLKYHNGDTSYRFLTYEKISDFDNLNTLFFQVMARDMEHRSKLIREEFANIPYLNSSLFEVSNLEHSTIKVSGLSQWAELPILPGSVLKKKKNQLKEDSLPTLKYLLSFLDAYNFASEGNEEVQDEVKTLINASVLGLIFEKINGHKDGAVFTPGVITMYMSREALVRTVIQKFNEYYGWSCKSLTDVYNKITDIPTANKIINSIRICDPAVGSGHFLVAALNELIAIKYELGVLVDTQGKLIRQADYNISIENDELIITDADNNLFSYNPNNDESRRVQETLFNEKKYIIENCLFGVDLNPNSVNICRLRLWIELLKNAYYTKESGYRYLETLPNIDINIKCGNSLLHRFDLNADIKDILKKTGVSIEQYKNAVNNYKNAQGKDEKYDLENLITEIKKALKTEIARNDPHQIRLIKKQAELYDLDGPQIFGFSPKEQKERAKRIATLKKEIKTEEDYLEEIRSNKMYLGAFEWRIEFPEVLDDAGNFVGFDCVIGNPPYIQLQKMEGDADILQRMNYESYARTGDIYCLFYELGNDLIKNGGHLCYITSNKWMRAGYGEAIRGYLATHTNPLVLLDFPGVKVFDSVTVEPNILLFQKASNVGQTLAMNISSISDLQNMSDFVQQQGNICDYSGSESWVILSSIEDEIKRKIEAIGIPLKEWDIQVNFGVKTGCNEAFIINADKRNEILDNCLSDDERKRTDAIIRPILKGRDIQRYSYNWDDNYIIATFPAIKYDIDDYPALKKYLLSFAKDELIANGYDWVAENYLDEFCLKKLQQFGEEIIIAGGKVLDSKNKPEKSRKLTTNKWFETQDSISYWEDFNQPKIIWKRIGSIIRFSYDDKGMIGLDSTCFATGEHISYLCCILNSLFGHYLLKDSPKTGTGDLLISVQAIEPIRVPYDENAEEKFAKLIELQLVNESEDIEKEINDEVFKLYNLSPDEIEYVRQFNNQDS